MTPLLLSAAIAVAQAPAQPAQPGTAPDRAPGARTQLDGKWTVLACEKEGRKVEDARNMTVNIRGNMITFEGDGAKDQKNLRIDFGPMNTLRVTEVDRGQQPGQPDRPGQPPAARPVTDQAGQPGEPGARIGADAKSGVYVLASDFLAIAVHDVGRTQPGQPDRPGQPPAARPVTDQAGQPVQPGARPGIGGPQQQAQFTLILQRADGQQGRPGQTDRNNDR